jgi:hypothetical protein
MRPRPTARLDVVASSRFQSFLINPPITLRIDGTIAAIERELVEDGLVRRWTRVDGLDESAQNRRRDRPEASVADDPSETLPLVHRKTVGLF